MPRDGDPGASERIDGPFASLSPASRAAVLNSLYGADDPSTVLEAAIRWDFRGRIALVSSFGAESAALLHLVAAIDPSTPVLFVDTQMLFPETHAYRRELAARLGLTDLRQVRPDARDLAAIEIDLALYETDPDRCCHLRKARPLERALEGVDAWITGRKRGQSSTRRGLSLFEPDAAGRLKLNPLVDWSAEELRSYMRRHDLPPHPLVAKGFPSIGCGPCTTAVSPGEDPRAGRWRGRAKTECGIHLENGRWSRALKDDPAPMDPVSPMDPV